MNKWFTILPRYKVSWKYVFHKLCPYVTNLRNRKPSTQITRKRRKMTLSYHKETLKAKYFQIRFGNILNLTICLVRQATRHKKMASWCLMPKDAAITPYQSCDLNSVRLLLIYDPSLNTNWCILTHASNRSNLFISQPSSILSKDLNIYKMYLMKTASYSN